MLKPESDVVFWISGHVGNACFWIIHKGYAACDGIIWTNIEVPARKIQNKKDYKMHFFVFASNHSTDATNALTH